jgi:hypothetical protein
VSMDDDSIIDRPNFSTYMLLRHARQHIARGDHDADRPWNDPTRRQAHSVLLALELLLLALEGV